MIKMLADASLPDLHLFFPEPFALSRFKTVEDLQQQLPDHSILLCRSTTKIDASLLANSRLDCIAAVSSGTDHIAIAELAARQIHLIDAKGANAWAVADYVVACFAYCQTQHYIQGSEVGVIGLGAVGSAVAHRLQGLGCRIHAYDPLRAAENQAFVSCELRDLYACDFVTVHANLHDNHPYPSRHLLDANFLSRLKPGAVILNAARGELVDEAAVLSCQKLLHYCTDVYANEPKISRDIVAFATLCTPHIAGHSLEARTKALRMVSQKLHHYYGINMPVVPILDYPSKMISGESWQAMIQSLYDPAQESRCLKHATNLTQTFLDLRAAHAQRHEFHCYTPEQNNLLLKIALGYPD